jgi:hypothetical protein
MSNEKYATTVSVLLVLTKFRGITKKLAFAVAMRQPVTRPRNAMNAAFYGRFDTTGTQSQQ